VRQRSIALMQTFSWSERHPLVSIGCPQSTRNISS